MKGGNTLYDHARPMGEVMAEISNIVKEYADLKRQNPDYVSVKEEYGALKEHMKTLEHSGLLGYPSD